MGGRGRVCLKDSVNWKSSPTDCIIWGTIGCIISSLGIIAAWARWYLSTPTVLALHLKHGKLNGISVAIYQ